MSNYPEPNVIPSQEYEELIDAYKLMHKDERTFMGISLIPLTYIIKSIFEENKVKSFLDYGCGKGLQYTRWKHHKDLGVMPTLYDPAVPEHDHLPDVTFHGVYSTDVMEHIPKEQLPETFENIFNRAERFVFLAICTQPAIAILPNGENAHCTVEPIGFWKTMVEKYAPKRVYTHIKTYGNCNNYAILNEDIYLEWYLEQF